MFAAYCLLVALPESQQRSTLRAGKGAIKLAVRSLRRESLYPASDELGRLVSHAFRIEEVLRDRSGGIRRLVDSEEYDKRLLAAHAHQLATLASTFATLSAELTAYAKHTSPERASRLNGSLARDSRTEANPQSE